MISIEAKPIESGLLSDMLKVNKSVLQPNAAQSANPYALYEQEKEKLRALRLSPQAYEQAVKEMIELLGL